MSRAEMQMLRRFATNHVEEFFQDPINADVVRTFRAHFAETGAIGGIPLMLRMHVLHSIMPPGGFAVEPGAKLGLLCRIIESAMSVVDWNKVAQTVLNFHIEGGK